MAANTRSSLEKKTTTSALNDPAFELADVLETTMIAGMDAAATMPAPTIADIWEVIEMVEAGAEKKITAKMYTKLLTSDGHIQSIIVRARKLIAKMRATTSDAEAKIAAKLPKGTQIANIPVPLLAKEINDVVGDVEVLLRGLDKDTVYAIPNGQRRRKGHKGCQYIGRRK